MRNFRLVSKNENRIATRRNDLVEARYRLTLQEQRLMLWVISCIEPDDQNFKSYRIGVKEIADVIGANNKNVYSTIEKTTAKLLGRLIEIHGENTKLQVALIASAEYNYGQGTVDIEVSQKLKKYLLQLKENFTSVRLKYAFQLSSTYALRIYELLVQYRKLGERKITVEELRRMLNIEEDKYKKWVNFEDRVLKTAYKEINQKTDVSFSYQKIKNGRKIEAIKFIFKQKSEPKKPNIPLPEPEKKEQESPTLQRLYTHGIDQKIAEKWLEHYSSRVIEEVLDTLDASLERGAEIKNRGGWLRSALAEGWKDTEVERKRTEETTRKMQRKQEAQQRHAETRKNDQEAAFRRYKIESITSLIKSLPEASERELRGMLKQSVVGSQAGAVKSVFTARFESPEVWYSPMAMPFATKLLAQERGLALLSFDEFVASEYKDS